MHTAQTLIRDYDAYYLQTAHIKSLKARGAPINGVKVTPDRLAALDNMAQWCRAKNLDPRHWLQSLFQSRRWLFAPQWTQLTSEKHLKKYRALPVSQAYQTKIANESATSKMQRGVSYDVNRDLSPTTEGIKQTYLGRGEADRCMAQMRSETLGYHPKSHVCARCSKAVVCAASLASLAGFDIVALRAGKITMEQAAAQKVQLQYGSH
jgi:hypothetical protein